MIRYPLTGRHPYANPSQRDVYAAGRTWIQQGAPDRRGICLIRTDLIFINFINQTIRANHDPLDDRVVLIHVDAQVVGSLLIVYMRWQLQTNKPQVFSSFFPSLECILVIAHMFFKISGNCDNDIALLVPFVDIVMRCHNFLKGIATINNRFDFVSREQIDKRK